MIRQCRAAAVALGLAASLLLPPAAARGSGAIDVPLTFYTDVGTTYYGEWTGPGTAACGWGWPAWQILYLPREGRTVWCSDRIGQPRGLYHVDVWEPNGWAVIAPYGEVQPVIPIDDD